MRACSSLASTGEAKASHGVNVPDVIDRVPSFSITGLSPYHAGVYLVVFYKCLRVLGEKYLEGRPTAILLGTALTIFVLVTVVRITVPYHLSDITDLPWPH